MLSLDQYERVSHVNGRIYTLLATYRAARRREQTRVAEEALLPPDELSFCLGFCLPKELAIASQTCRHFKAVVASVVRSRIALLGLELPSWQKPDTEVLARLEAEMRRAPELLASLAKSKRRAEFKGFHDSVICFHPVSYTHLTLPTILLV